MTEISNNITGITQQPQQTVKTELVKSAETVAEQEIAPTEQAQVTEINEIPDNPADRSTVKPADNIENDIRIFSENEDLAKQALEISELAEKRYTEAGIQDAELKALAVGKAFVDEFQK